MITPAVREAHRKWLASGKSKEWRKKLGERNKQNTGKKLSKEHRKKISVALRGLPKPEEWKRRMSLLNVGKRPTPICKMARKIQQQIGKEAVLEFQVSLFRIDVAIPSRKVAIEIDGRGHLYWQTKEKDERKDRFLKSKGWIVIRVPWYPEDLRPTRDE